MTAPEGDVAALGRLTVVLHGVICESVTHQRGRFAATDCDQAARAVLAAGYRSPAEVTALVAEAVGAERERMQRQHDADMETLRDLQAAYREALGIPPSEHQQRRMERLATDLESALGEITRLRAGDEQ